MKIGVSVSSLDYGGAEKQAIIDANRFSESGNVVFITFHTGPLEDFLNDRIKLIKVEKEGYLKTALRLRKIIKNEQIEIVHVHLYAPMVISAIACLFSRTRVVWNFHSHSYDDVKKGRLGQKITSRLPSVRKILFPCDELLKYYEKEKYRFPKRKLQIVYNSCQMTNVNSQANGNKGKIIVGYIGRIVKLKRLQYLIELGEKMKAKKLYNWEIWIVGDGTELDNLRKITKNKNLEDEVLFFGFQADTVHFYNQFNLFVLPSEEEVLSLALIDAMVMGIPSIAFSVGGNSEIISSDETGYIVESKEELFQKVIFLMKNKSLREEMQKKAIEQGYSKFSQETRYDHLIRLYEDMISE